MNRLLAFFATFALLAPTVQADDPLASKSAAQKNTNSKSSIRRPVRGPRAEEASQQGEVEEPVVAKGLRANQEEPRSLQAARNPSANRTNDARSASRGGQRKGVVAASHQEQIDRPVPQPMAEPMMVDGGRHWDGLEHGSSCGCDSCGGGGYMLGGGCDGSCGGQCDGGCGIGSSCDLGCNSCFQSSRLCLCLPRDPWVQADYLMWWHDPMRVPPLVIQGNPAVLPANVLLGEGNTNGRDMMLDNRRAGGRLRFGWRLTRFNNLSIQGEYLGLGNASDTFTQLAGGNPIAVPFVDFAAPANGRNSSLIGHNRISFEARSQLDGGGVSFRRNLYCGSDCAPSRFSCNPIQTQHRFDVLLGYRYLQLQESLQGNYSGGVPAAAPANTYTIQDRFRTLNQFNGVDFGINWQGRRGYWSLDALMKMSLGNVREVVRIDGRSTYSNAAGVVLGGPINSGLYAAPSNIGDYTRNSFAVVPELGTTLGYQLTKRVKLNLGYSFIYWSKVVRPGDQVSQDLNSNNIPILNAGRPIPNPPSDPNRPQFKFVETDYWVQGLNLGAEFRW